MGEEEKIKKLREWLERNGVNLEKFPLSLHSFGDAGNGFIATRDIQAGELLVSVSSTVLMSPTPLTNNNNNNNNNNNTSNNNSDNNNKNSKIFTTLSSSPLVSSLPNNVVLCLVLAYERFISQDSFWSPYFPVLPEDYTISVNYTEEQCQMLQNNGTILETQKQKDTMTEAYNNILPILKSIGEELTLSQFQWAWGVIQTRACYLQLDSGTNKGSLVLVPWADFLNHSIDVDTTAYFDEKDKSYKMFTNTPFKKGEQVFISYGKHPNPVLLHYYGFAIDGNPEDVVEVDITNTQIVQQQLNLQSATSSKHKILSHADKQNKQLWAAKEKILTENGLGVQGKFTFQMGDSPISWNLLTVARILHASAPEFSQKLYMRVFDDEMISAKNELDTCQFFIAIAEKLLKAYNTSLEEDDLLLSGNLPFVETCIVTTRRQEKRILNYVIEQCKNKIATLT